MNASISEQVQQQLLVPAGLSDSDLETALSMTMTRGVDYADLYFQQSRQESWVLEDGIIKDGGYHLEQGVGVRACSGEKTGFAYSDDLILPALHKAAKAAQAISHQGNEQKCAVWQKNTSPVLYSHQDPILVLSVEQKLALLREADAAARAATIARYRRQRGVRACRGRRDGCSRRRA